MLIAIKSEIDSRPLLYPLMRALKNYGSLMVASSNPQLVRLIEDELSGGFRNIRIMVDTYGAGDSLFEEEGIALDDFDFIVTDNLGITFEYDVMFVLLGTAHSEAFDEEVLLLRADSKVRFVQFGKESRRKGASNTQEKIKRQDKEEAENKEYDPADKFKDPENQDTRRKSKKEKLIPAVPWPSFESIETLEALKQFGPVPQQLVTVIYEALKDFLAVDQRNFQKEVTKNDASSGNIRGRNSLR